jgi:hypothetical protein
MLPEGRPGRGVKGRARRFSPPMTKSVSSDTFDLGAVAGHTEGAIDGFEYVDGMPGLVWHPRPHRVPAGAPLMLAGWALDPTTRGIPQAVHVVVDRGAGVLAETGVSRYDVAARFAEPTDEKIGYRAVVPTAKLPGGRHQIRAYVRARDGAWYEAGRRDFAVYEPMRPGLAASPSPVTIFIDQVVDVAPDGALVGFNAPVPIGRYVMLSGWALHTAVGSGPAGIYALDDRGGRWSVPCDIARPDIRAARDTGDDRLGFEILIPAVAVGRGRHEVEVGACDDVGRPIGSRVPASFDVVGELRPFPNARERAGAPAAAACLLAGSKSAAVGTPDETLEVARGTIVTIDGWALQSDGTAATEVFIELSIPEVGGTPYRYPALAGFRRIARRHALATSPVDDAWFMCRIATETLPRSRFRLDVLVVESARRVVARRTLGSVSVLSAVRSE